MNELRIFNNTEFGEIRTTVIDDKVYFCGNDIANALGYKTPRHAISTHCPPRPKTCHRGTDRN